MICAQHNIAYSYPTATPAGRTIYIIADSLYRATPSDQGEDPCMVVVDGLSRWTEVFATSSASANFVAQTLLREVIPRRGLFRTLDSDQGTHFTSKVLQGVRIRHWESPMLFIARIGRKRRGLPGAISQVTNEGFGNNGEMYVILLLENDPCVASQVKSAHEEQAPGDNREHRLTPGERVCIKIHQAGVLGRRWSGPCTRSGKDHNLSSVGSHFSRETISRSIMGEVEVAMIVEAELK